MPSIGRSSIPEEFLDVTSSLLLTQPDAEYLHAKMILAALDAQFDGSSTIGLPIPDRQIMGSGAGYPSLEDQQLVLSDPIMSQALIVAPELGKPQVGHTLRINRPKFTDSTYTFASREVPVGNVISTTPIAVGSEQTQITLKRWAGPYSNSQAAVAPYAIERFDADRMLHNVNDLKNFHLKRDFHKTIDAFGVLLFDSADATIYPTGMTADNDSTAAGDFPFSYEQIIRTQTSLEEASIPKFSGTGRYVMVLTPRQIEHLMLDEDYQRLSTYEKVYNPLFQTSYVRTVGAFDIFKSVSLRRVANSSSVNIQYGQAFGPGMVGVGMGGMPRVATHTADNYGETAILIWLAYLGFQVLDSRFGRSVRSS